jgi:hypothetical protein
MPMRDFAMRNAQRARPGVASFERGSRRASRIALRSLLPEAPFPPGVIAKGTQEVDPAEAGPVDVDE